MTEHPAAALGDGQAPSEPVPAGPRATLRSVALPTEHGGWGLTLEPAVLGLLVAPSWAGAALAVAAFVAFMARTPVKLVLVDHWRRRRLDRTVLAERVAAIELGALGALVAAAALTANGPFWVPLAIAVPFFATELWFDMRSRSRRLVPELAGAVGIASVVAAIVLADDRSTMLAIALWTLLAARAIASIPFVRIQLRRLRNQAFRRSASDLAQVVATGIGVLAIAFDEQVLAGFVALLLLAAFQVGAVRRTPPRAAIIGSMQLVLGLALVGITAVGVTAG